MSDTNNNRKIAFRYILPLSAAAMLITAFPAWPDINVLQSRNDPSRTGANTQETILNTANVNVKTFGRLFSYPVDGSVYAQPLYVSNLAIPGKGTRNVVFVATMHDMVYAFDADSNQGPDQGLLWVRTFKNPKLGIVPVPSAEVGSRRNLEQDIGIEATPVIDIASQTIYFVERTKQNINYTQRLRALDLATGQDKPGSPVLIEGSYQGINFDPKLHNQRAGLALASGQVVITWSSHGDWGDYHGWVMTYDAASLAQTGTFTTTTTVRGGGIWASGRAPAVMNRADGGQDVILFTGNAVGTTQGYNGTTNFPESVLRLKIDPKLPGNAIKLVDWFTPDNWKSLDKGDLDLGGSGPTLLPGTNYIIGGGKQGIMYVVNPRNMGKLQEGNPNLIQTFRAVKKLHIMGGPVLWDRSPAGKTLLMYNWGESDTLKAYTFKGRSFDTDNITTSKEVIQGHPGGILSLSADGAKAGTGILWSLSSNAGTVLQTIKQGVLRAYDAENVSHLLWSSRMDTGDDTLVFAKFTPPTVANGKVYVATFSNKLMVYGLLPQARPQHDYVTLLSRVGGQALEVPGATRIPGTTVDINPDRGFARQVWEVKAQPNGSVRLISTANGLALDNSRAGNNDGIPVQIYSERPQAGNSAQDWYIVPTNKGYVKLVSLQNNRALTLADNTGGNGSALWTSPQNGQTTQDWKIIAKADAGITECNTSAMEFVSALPPGQPTMTAMIDNNNTVAITQRNNWLRQTWKLAIHADGGYEFISAKNGLLLSAPTGDDPEDTTVKLSPRDNSILQKWTIAEPSYIDTYSYSTYSHLVSGNTQNVLSIDQGVSDDGTPITAIPNSGANYQQWRIQDTNSIWCLN